MQFCVSLTVNRLSEQFFGAVNAGNTHRITTSITLTLLFREYLVNALEA
jgi:ribosomal protein S4E